MKDLRKEVLLPVNKLQTKSLLWGFLPLQGTNQLLPQLRQVLLIHLEMGPASGWSDGQTDRQAHRLVPAPTSYLTFVAGLSFLFDVGVELRDIGHVRVRLSAVGVGVTFCRYRR